MKNSLDREQALMRSRMRSKRRRSRPSVGTNSKPCKRRELPAKPKHTENALERQVKEFLVRKGWKVLRNGWPDYLVMKGDTPILVEVKSVKDRLSPQQREMHSVLSKLGLEVVVVRPEVEVLHEVFGVEC